MCMNVNQNEPRFLKVARIAIASSPIQTSGTGEINSEKCTEYGADLVTFGSAYNRFNNLPIIYLVNILLMNQ
jgi:hypothetical protein